MLWSTRKYLSKKTRQQPQNPELFTELLRLCLNQEDVWEQVNSQPSSYEDLIRLYTLNKRVRSSNKDLEAIGQKTYVYLSSDTSRKSKMISLWVLFCFFILFISYALLYIFKKKNLRWDFLSKKVSV